VSRRDKKTNTNQVPSKIKHPCKRKNAGAEQPKIKTRKSNREPKMQEIQQRTKIEHNEEICITVLNKTFQKKIQKINIKSNEVHP